MNESTKVILCFVFAVVATACLVNPAPPAPVAPQTTADREYLDIFSGSPEALAAAAEASALFQSVGDMVRYDGMRKARKLQTVEQLDGFLVNANDFFLMGQRLSRYAPKYPAKVKAEFAAAVGDDLSAKLDDVDRDGRSRREKLVSACYRISQGCASVAKGNE